MFGLDAVPYRKRHREYQPKARTPWAMGPRWTLYCRGVLYMSLQAGVVAAISAFNLPLAFAVSGGLSYLWTGNVQAQAGLPRTERIIYALGAGSGTVLGMALGWFIA